MKNAVCMEKDIGFFCLSPNATHLCQPLDVAFFSPLKEKWRIILKNYKSTKGKITQTI